MNRSRENLPVTISADWLCQLYPLRSTCEPHVAAQLSRTLSVFAQELVLRARVLAVLFVMFGLWIVQTDCFPMTQDLRPSWYLYGWPICFATASRRRFQFTSFDTTSFLIDLFVTTLMTICAFLAGRHFERKKYSFSLGDALAAITGIALMLLVISNSYSSLLENLSFSLPQPSVSEMDGNVRPLVRISPLAIPSLCVGAFSIGFVSTLGVFRLINSLKPTKETDG